MADKKTTLASLDGVGRDDLKLSHDARHAWGEWLGGFSWDHFATLTFVYDSQAEAALREFGRWIRRLEQRAQRRVSWFFALEPDSGGQLHIHVLLAGTDRVGVGGLRGAWLNGKSHIARYQSHGGAARYVTKFLGSKCAGYDLNLGGMRMPPHRGEKGDRHGRPA
jgi:hypothetical protein